MHSGGGHSHGGQRGAAGWRVLTISTTALMVPPQWGHLHHRRSLVPAAATSAAVPSLHFLFSPLEPSRLSPISPPPCPRRQQSSE